MKKTSSRRDFLRIAGSATAFLAIGVGNVGGLFAAPIRKLSLAKGGYLGEGFEGGNGEFELNNFILITPDNKITIFNPRPEMGQGTWQSMPALIAEELEVTLEQVEIRMTSGAKRHGRQGVGGSGSVRQSWIPLRQVGAAAKEMLIKAAAQRWGAAESDCFAANLKIQHRPSGKNLTYGELVAEASKLEVPKEPKLKDSKDFRILGKPMPRPDVPSKVNGSAIFGIDAKVPGMLYASVQHCPTIHGKVLNFNAEEVLKIPGVKNVVKTERKMPHKAVEAVAVVADNYWSAVKGRRVLQVEWDNAGFDQISTEQYFSQALDKAKSEDGNEYSDKVGDFKTAYSNAAKTLDAQYVTPFASHAQIEPMTATAWVREDEIEIWAPVQSSQWVIEEVAGYFKISEEDVKVNVLFMGGSFGRKGYLDFVLEACHVSKMVNAPVKLIWTREDDFANGPYRPGMVDALRGGLDANGNLIAFEHKVCGASIGHQCFGDDLNGKPDGWSDDAISQESSPYSIPNRRQAHVHQPTDIPIVWWRSVYASTNVFGHESFIDELAHAAGRDPLDFRLDMLKNQPRWTALLKKLEEVSNYRKEKVAGKPIGVAIAHSFGSTCAYAITVSQKDTGVKIEKVVGVIDCGMTVNPDTVKAQTEGNVVMALSAAIKPGITFSGGEAQETNYHQYPILTLRETPPIEIYIMENTETPGGVGEPGLPPFTPALFNAVFLATGKRIRTLPVDLENLG